MIMIIGGAYQGKTDFARAHFGLSDGDISDGAVCPLEEPFSAKCVKNYQLLVKRLLDNAENVRGYTERLCGENPELVVIIDEIGCGIIPIDKSDRIWREETGRAGCIIAQNSSSVIRITCGLATAIKGNLP